MIDSKSAFFIKTPLTISVRFATAFLGRGKERVHAPGFTVRATDRSRLGFWRLLGTQRTAYHEDPCLILRLRRVRLTARTASLLALGPI